MTHLTISSTIKPLVSNLLRIHIGKYLKTADFKHLLLEHNFDEMWEAAKQQIRSQSNVVFIGFDPSSDYEGAFQLILETYFKKNKNLFFKVLVLTLQDFMRWDKDKTDLSKIIVNLEELNIPKEQLDKLKANSEYESIQIGNQASNKSIVFEQMKLAIDKTLCFVIMPFTDALNPIYEHIIKPVVSELKLIPLRADEVFIAKPIIEDIWNKIKVAKFLIADLTDRNPNVFYELGLAHAFGKEVILISQSLSDVPFDLRHFRIIIYKDSISGADDLKLTLKKFIKEAIK